jgi:mannose-1-phosphate guanylyltransferase
LGTRFRPLSDVRAKAAVPVAGQPLIHRIIAWLSSHGIADFVLNLHHKPETITREVGDGSPLGVRVRYSWEDPILGSGGGPRRALPLVGVPTFVIVNGDTLTDVDLHAMWDAHAASGALVTLALIPNPRPEHYGGVIVDGDGAILRFAPRGTEMRSYHFIGVQIVSASVFAELPDQTYAESVSGVYRELIARAPGSVRGFISPAEFHDVGTPRDYVETSLRIAQREQKLDRLAGDGTVIESSALVTGSILWDNVAVGRGCRLIRCVAADGVAVPAGTVLEECTLVNDDKGELNIANY